MAEDWTLGAGPPGVAEAWPSHAELTPLAVSTLQPWCILNV